MFLFVTFFDVNYIAVLYSNWKLRPILSYNVIALPRWQFADDTMRISLHMFNALKDF